MKTSSAKAKGRDAENVWAAFLREDGYFPEAQRERLHGAVDLGDIAGIPYWAQQVKATKKATVMADLRAAKQQAENRGVPNFALIWKPPGYGEASVAEWPFIVPGWLGRRIMKEYQ